MIFEVLWFLFIAIWLLLPAYTPNNFAVVFGGGKPLDLGKNFIDGKRILGDGKTFKGFFAGVVGGIFVAHLELLIETFFSFHIFSTLTYPEFLKLAFALSFGSLAGDCAGSFVKRRFGVDRGGKFPLLDQYDFLLFSLFLSWFLCREAFSKLFTLPVLVVAFVITPILHRATNVIAYKLGLKDVPW